MERLIFRLRTRDVRREGVSAAGMSGLIATAGLMLLPQGEGGISLWRILGVLMLFEGVFGVAIGLFQAIRGREPGDIELSDAALLIYPNERARRRISVPLTDLRALLMRANDRVARIYLGHRGGTVVLDARELANAEDLPRLVLALRERIGALPNGAERLAYLEEQRALARFAMGRRPVVTLVFLGLIAVAFSLQLKRGALSNPIEMLRLGAGAPALIEQGEYFRLVSANFLHGAGFHITLNAMGIWILGRLIEQTVGGWRLGIVVLVSALGGAGASTLLAEAPIMMGASTSLYGMAGALVVIERAYRWQLPPNFRESIRLLIILIVVNIVITIPIPFVAKAAHIGGLLSGAGAMALMIGRERRYQPRAAASMQVRAVAIALSALFVVGLAQAVRAALRFEPAAALRVLRDTPSIDPGTLNDTAWLTLIQPDASPETLAVCLDMAQRAVTHVEEGGEAVQAALPAFLDTRAGALYRVGRGAEAVADQLRAMQLDHQERAIYVAHLRRIANSLPAIEGLSREGEALVGDPSWAGRVAVADVQDGALRGVAVGRPDSDGRMRIERSGLSPTATFTLRWVGRAELGDWVPPGGWRWFEFNPKFPGELP